MATQSSSPPNPTDDSPSKPATDIVQPHDNQQSSRAEQTKQISPSSVFVNSEPIRDDQVQNAVKFLSHPKVRGSPVVYRRSFLEKKGLTKEEIDEAFRLVPDPSPSSQPASVSQDRQVNPISNLQSQVPQTLQPTATAPTGFVSSVGTLAQTRFRWYHAILAVGFLAISGAGTAVLVKNALVPRLKSWIRKVVLEEDNDSGGKINAKPSLAEETAAAAKAAAAAAADVAKASQAMLSSKHEEKKYFEEFMKLLDVQVKEMKSMSSSIQKLEGQTINSRNTSYIAQEDSKVSAISSKQQNFTQQAYVNGKVDSDSHSVRSSSPPPTYVEPSVAPHPKSYMDIMGMVQRGEKPPNIRDINDLPPNPNQQIPNPRIAPRTKPWDLGPAQIASNQVVQSQLGTETLNSSAQYNGMKYVSDGEKSVPWRQQKSATITEIESEDEAKAANSGGRVQRRWVPPQAPPVAMSEAAEAIRRPKPVKKEELTEDSKYEEDGATDELQRVTKISESGGEMESNGTGFGVDSSEIQVE